MTRKNGLYIQMFSIHGLVRAENMELGRDADTGGQIKYVVELCKNLSKLDGVRRVDLFTRWISDKAVSEDYAYDNYLTIHVSTTQNTKFQVFQNFITHLTLNG